MNDLFYSLGLDITDFKTSARAAQEQANEVKSTLRGFRDVITLGGVATAVIGFFKASIDYAQQLKGEVDENTAAAQRMGDAYSKAGDETLSASAKAVGAFGRMLELAGTVYMIARAAIPTLIKEGKDAADKAVDEVMTTITTAEKTAAAAATAERARDEFRKKNEAISQRISAEAIRLASQEHEIRLKALTVQERVNQLGNEYWAKVRELATFEGDGIERRQKENEMRKASLALLQAQQDLLDDNARKEKEAASVAKQAAAEKKRAQDDEMQRVEQIAKLRLKGVENLTAAEQVQLDILEGRLTEEQRLAEVKTLNAKLMEGTILPAEKRRLEALVGVTSEMQTQIKMLEIQAKITKAISVRGFGQFEGASDEALQELIRKNQAAIGRNTALMFSQGDMGNYTTKWDTARLQQELANARQELDFRRQPRRDLELGGEALARRNFQGDPLLFDEVLQRVADKWEKVDETNDLLKKTNHRLEQLQTSQAVGLRELGQKVGRSV